MPDLHVLPEDSTVSLPELLAEIARLLADTPCQHCGQAPYPWAARLGLPGVTGSPTVTGPAGGPPTDGNGAVRRDAAALDEVDDDERGLWRLVEEGDRVQASAPPEPPAAQVAAADNALAGATANAEKLATQAAMTERALANPASWLRPSRRAVLVKQLRRQQATAVIAAAHRTRAEQRRAALRRMIEQRAAFLVEHRDTLDAAADAQAELDRRIDGLIHAYGRLPEPPPWFRYGLGYPPDPARYPEWLKRARAAIAHRRRYGVDHPLEPMG